MFDPTDNFKNYVNILFDFDFFFFVFFLFKEQSVY